MNLVILKGNVGKEPEVKAFDSGNVVMTFSVATSDSYKDKDGSWKDGPTQWHTVQLWGRNKIDYTPVQKGDTVHVMGKIQYREYQKDDEKRYTTDIVATEVNIIKRLAKVTAPPITEADDPKFKTQANVDTQGFTIPKQAESAPAPIGGDVPLPNDTNTPF